MTDSLLPNTCNVTIAYNRNAWQSLLLDCVRPVVTQVRNDMNMDGFVFFETLRGQRVHISLISKEEVPLDVLSEAVLSRFSTFIQQHPSPEQPFQWPPTGLFRDYANNRCYMNAFHPHLLLSELGHDLVYDLFSGISDRILSTVQRDDSLDLEFFINMAISLHLTWSNCLSTVLRMQTLNYRQILKDYSRFCAAHSSSEWCAEYGKQIKHADVVSAFLSEQLPGAPDGDWLEPWRQHFESIAGRMKTRLVTEAERFDESFHVTVIRNLHRQLGLMPEQEWIVVEAVDACLESLGHDFALDSSKLVSLDQT